jgi:pimeloyl-ACP methyl ester carboxylesterase
MGFSGGAAVTVYCAANDTRITSVVACACPSRFFSIAEFSMTEEFLEHSRRIGTIRDPDFPHSIEEWVRGFEQVSPERHVHRISPRPILFLHGSRDETVDPGHARELYDKAGEPKDISIVEGGEHKLRLSEPAMQAALSWLKRVNRLGEARP